MPDQLPATPSSNASTEGQTLQTLHGSGGYSDAESPETRSPSELQKLPTPAPAALAIAGYVIEGELGRGGMGVVYKARQQGLGRLVALKMILHGDHAGSEDRQRFQREAESLARLRHENIVQVYEVGEHDGKPFMSLEYVEGGALDKHLKSTPVPPVEAARLIEKLARAMQGAHDAGIIHRDLKPANILLAFSGVSEKRPSDRRFSETPLNEVVPKVTDFGLAKQIDEGGQTHSGSVLGTPSYMAPEQAAGKVHEIGPAADVYALGAILYEMLTGRPPFKGTSAMDTIRQVLAEDPVPVTRLQAQCPADIDTICLKCLEKAPGRRYGSAQELAEDLRRFQSGEPILARPISRLQRVVKWTRRRPALAALAGVSVAALLVLAGVWVSFTLSLDRARLTAEVGEKEARRQKSVAQEQRQKAEEGQAAALAEKRRADRQLAEALTAQGLRARDQGHHGAALHFHAAALDTLTRLGEDVSVARAGLSIAVRQVPSLQALFTLRERPERIVAGPDGRRLLVFTRTDSDAIYPSADVYLVDVATGRSMAQLQDGGKRIQQAEFSPDGRLVLTLGRFDNRVSLWKAETGARLCRLEGHGDIVSHAVFSPDSRQVLTSSRDHTARLWDAATGKLARELRGHSYFVWHGRFSPDGRTIATAGGDATARLWDAATGAASHVLRSKNGVFDVSFNAQGTRIITQPFVTFINRSPGEDDYHARLWDAGTGKELEDFAETSRATFVGGDRVFLRSAFRGFGAMPDRGRLWREDKGAFIGDFEGRLAAVSAAGTQLALLSDGVLRLCDAQTGRVRRTLLGRIQSVQFGPDADTLLTDFGDNTARLWNAQTGHLLTSFEGHGDRLTGVAFVRSGQRVLTASADGGVRTWAFSTGPDVRFTGHRGSIDRITFAPRADLLITNSVAPPGWTIYDARRDDSVRVWQASTGRLLVKLEGRRQLVQGPMNLSEAILTSFGSGALEDVRIDADTNRLVLVVRKRDYNPLLRLVEMSSGRVIAERDGHRLKGWCGRQRCLLTADKQDQVHAWDLETGRLRYRLEGNMVFERDELPDFPGPHLLTLVPGGDKGRFDIQLWDAETGKAGRKLVCGRAYPGEAMALSPDGSRLALIDGSNKGAIYDLGRGQLLGEFEVPAFMSSGDLVRGKSVDLARFSPDGRWLVTVGNDSTLWDGANGKKRAVLQGRFLLFSPDSSRALTLSEGQGFLWDLSGRTGSVSDRSTLQTGAALTAALYTPDGRRLITGSAGGLVQVWDTASVSPLLEIASSAGPISSLRLSEDGRKLAAGTQTGDVTVWELSDSRLSAQLLARSAQVLGGSEVGRNGKLIGLSPEQWQARRRELLEQLGALPEEAEEADRQALAVAVLRIDPASVAALRSALRGLKQAGQQARARQALALADIEVPAVRDLLLGALKERESAVLNGLLPILRRAGPEVFPALTALLDRKDVGADVKANVLVGLRDRGTAAVPVLARFVAEREPMLSLEAARALRELGTRAEAAIPALVKALSLEDAETRFEAALALDATGPACVGALIAALDSEAHSLRESAVLLLNRQAAHAKLAIPKLMRLALADGAPTIRAAAVAALEQIDSTKEKGFSGEQCKPLLADAVQSKQVSARLQAVAVLRDLGKGNLYRGDPLMPLLLGAKDDPAAEMREAVVLAVLARNSDQLSALGEMAVPPLVKLLCQPDVKRRESAIMALWKLGPTAVSATRDLLRAREDRDSSTVQIYASHALRAIGEVGLEPLLAALADPSPVLRAEAAFWLGGLGPKAEKAAPVLEKLFADRDEKVRLRAATAHRSIRKQPAAVLPLLRELLTQSKEDEIRREAAAELRDLGVEGAAAVPALAQALTDRHLPVRLEAARALLVLGNEKQQAIAALIKLLEPSKERTGLTAAAELAKLGDAGRPAIPALRAALAVPRDRYDINDRIAFARALATLGAADELIDALCREDRYSGLRSDLARALVEVCQKQNQQIGKLVTLLEHADADIRRHAVESLARLGQAAKESLPQLRRRLEDSDASVRVEVARAIQQIEK